jgi:hypothetical protein
MSAPALIIRLELEQGPPRVTVDAPTEGQFERLRDWLQAGEDVAELVEQAIGLMLKQRPT